MNRIYTNNEGKLETISPFNFLRGIENKDICMGLAKNKVGEVFEIYPYPCDENNGGVTSRCYCFATAVKVKEGIKN